ncbi:MAG: DUF4175 family protein [Planctomycetaceae bacterium]|nr:DUF4175 family protein [Planctomycetaceae bacterium]
MSILNPTSELQELLQSLRRRWQRWGSFRAGLQTLLILIAGLWFLWVLDTFYFLPTPWRSAAFALVVTSACLWFYSRFQKLRNESPTDSQLAALIEDSHPELEEQLLAAVDYQRQHTDSHLERELQQSAIQQAVQNLRSLDLQSSIRPARTVRTGILFGTLFLVAGIFFFAFSNRTAPWQRILIPWQPATSTPTIIVEEGNQSVPSGSSLTLAARLTEETRNGNELNLQLNWQTGDSSLHTQQLHYDAATHTFPIHWDQIERSREYWISSRNSFDESARYQIQVVNTPQLESALLTVTPPGYTGGKPAEYDGALGNISVPVESDVDLTFSSNQQIAAGKVVFQPDDAQKEPTSIPLQLSADARTAEVELPASESGLFFIQFVDQHGFAYQDQIERHLQVQSDQPPSIEPAMITEIQAQSEANRQFELPVKVVDDFAVTHSEMIIKTPDQPARIISPVESPPTEAETDVRFQFPLSAEELENASNVEVTFRATDNRSIPRPNETWSDPVPLSELLDSSLIEDPAALEAAMDKALQKSLEELRNKLERQEADVDKLAIRARLDQALEGGDRRDPEELIQEEQQLSLQLESLARKFAEHALYKELAPMAQHIARHELPLVEEHLQASKEDAQASPRNALRSLTAAGQQLKSTVKEVAQLQDWLEKLIDLKKEIPNLNEIAQRSQDLANELSNETNPASVAEQEAAGEALDQSMEDFLTRHPELAEAAQAALMEQLRQLAGQIQGAAEQQSALTESIDSDLGSQQAELRSINKLQGQEENLTEEERQELQAQLAELQNKSERQQQRAATLALQLAQSRGANSPETEQALQLVRDLEESAIRASIGQLSEALQASRRAEETARQLSNTQPELEEATRELRKNQEALSRQFQSQANRPAARHAARQEGQSRIHRRATQLEHRLEQLTNQALQLATSTGQETNRLAEKLNTPQQFLLRSDKVMERSSKRLQSHDYLLARDAARDAALLLKQAASTLQHATETDGEPTAPIPSSFSQQIADAAQHLQRAREQLSERTAQAQAQNQPGQNQPGQNGEGNNGQNGKNANSKEGQPPADGASSSSKNLQQAAQALNQASQQLQNQQGAGNESGSTANSDQQGSSANQGEQGGSGTKQVLTAEELQQELDLLSQRPWGSVSTELQTEIRDASRYRHKSDYARQIKSYFKQLAAPRTPESYLEPAAKESP